MFFLNGTVFVILLLLLLLLLVCTLLSPSSEYSDIPSVGRHVVRTARPGCKRNAYDGSLSKYESTEALTLLWKIHSFWERNSSAAWNTTPPKCAWNTEQIFQNVSMYIHAGLYNILQSNVSNTPTMIILIHNNNNN